MASGEFPGQPVTKPEIRRRATAASRRPDGNTLTRERSRRNTPIKSELFYDDYEVYLAAQISKAKRTRRRTRRGGDRLGYCVERIRQLYPEAETLLTVGCRDDFEIEFLESHGFVVDGIDLYATKRIIECDMSKIHRSAYFAERTYDVVLSVSSLEHCMDLEGFATGLREVCRRAFVCICPNSRAPNAWDCAKHPFMKDGDNHQELARCFPGFRIRVNEKHRKGRRLFFILERDEHVGCHQRQTE